MQFLFTDDPRRPDSSVACPPIIAPLPETPWVVYRPDSLVPNDIAEFVTNSPAGIAAAEKAYEIADDNPRVVMLDHPRFTVLPESARFSREYHAFAEQMIWNPLRDSMGRRGTIVQFGADSRRWGHLCPSLNATFSCYDHTKINEMAAGAFPAPLTPEEISQGCGGPESWWGVWLPGPGQWTPKGVWSANHYQRACEAARIRGLNVITWFDPRENRFTVRHWQSVCRVICYHRQWPVTPAANAISAGNQQSFDALLQALSAAEGAFDMGELLDVLAQWGD